MFEKQDEPLQMGRFELAVNAVKRMGNSVRDLPGLKVLLQLKDVLAQSHDVLMLRLRDSPNEKMNLARILRKISRNLLTDKCIR
jgi:hypothetical protein